MRIVFFGTPDFAVPTLEALSAEDDLRPLLVVSQPSRPVGRRREPQAPPVIVAAREQGLETVQLADVRDQDFLARLDALAPDVAVVVAFGQIFRRRLLALPRLGCVNLHASLLPRFRGAAPIQASIAAGDSVTGVTAMRMSRGLDSGPMLQQASLAIGPDETTPELSPRLAALGGSLMVETLRHLEAGSIEARPQDEDAVTYAPRLERTDAEVDWHLKARQIYDRWRAFQPWPGLSTQLGGRPLKVLACQPGDGPSAQGSEQGSAAASTAASRGAPGTLLGVRGDAMEVVCGGGTILSVQRVQRPGKQPVSAPDFVNGERLESGELLGS